MDDRIADLRTDFGDTLPAEVDTALDGVRQLAALRTAAVAGQTGPDQIMAGYGPVNTALINSLQLRLNVDTRTSTGRQVLALDGLLRTGESLSAGATLIVLVAARPNAQTVTAYVANFAALSDESARLQALVTPEQLDLLSPGGSRGRQPHRPGLHQPERAGPGHGDRLAGRGDPLPHRRLDDHPGPVRGEEAGLRRHRRGARRPAGGARRGVLGDPPDRLES